MEFLHLVKLVDNLHMILTFSLMTLGLIWHEVLKDQLLHLPYLSTCPIRSIVKRKNPLTVYKV
jgi:hypothetical protein